VDCRLSLAVYVGPEAFYGHVAAVLAPVAAYGVGLFRGEIIGVDFLESPGVDENLVRIHEIAVHIIEVVDEHVAPECEAVEVHGF